MTIKKPAIFGRPISLAARVTWLVAIAMTLVFLVFNWISIGSLDRHFAEMDEEELGVIARSVIRALGEVHDDGDAQACDRGTAGPFPEVGDRLQKILLVQCASSR